MARMTNPEIKSGLTNLRDDLRSGKATIYTRPENTNFKTVVALYLPQRFPLNPEQVFSNEHMNPQTVKRFASLFATVPDGPKSQDDVATAIQNFINRRSEPWAFMRDDGTVVQDIETETPESPSV